MTDPLTTAITNGVTTPQQSAVDGASVTSRTLADQIAAKKFLDANAGMQALATGGAWFPRVITCPPGARGGNTGDDCY